MKPLRNFIIAAVCIAAAGTHEAYAARPLPVVSKDGKNYYEYIVRRGETIYSITHQFEIDKELFLKCNPDVATDGLKADQPVYLPVDAVPEKKATPMQVENITGTGSTHLVKKGETLYGISKRYNTTVEKLIEMNPHAADGIKSGQVLLLPVSENSAAETIAPDTTEPDETDITEPAPERAYSIAVLLPLMLNSSESDERAAKTAASYTGFVKGLLMAADTLGRTGEKVTLHILDTEGTDAHVSSLLNDSRVRNADVVLAPDAADQLAIIADAPDTDFGVFNIFNVQDTTYSAKPNVIQANIDHDTMYSKAISALMSRFKKYTPVILMPEGGRAEKMEFVNEVRQRYANTIGAPEIKEIHFDGNLDDEDLTSLQPDTERYVFIPVSGTLNEFNRIQAALCRLKESAADPNNIMLFGYPDWIAFRIDRLEKLHKLGTTIYSRFYDNPDDPDARSFSEKYKQNFGCEVRDLVPKQEILGFDTGCYLIKALRTSEGNISDEPIRYTGIQSAFSFDRATEDRGMVNNALFIINYRTDGSVIKEIL